MAEGFEPYHVPQQSRRDKLRVGGCLVETATAHQNNNHNLHGLFPLYDPSILTSDLMSHGCNVKEEGVNFMGFVSSSSASAAAANHHHYTLDPHSSLAGLNPSSVQEHNPFMYHLRDFDQSSYNGAHEVFVYKPEPLSLTHHESSGCHGGSGGQGLSLSLSSHQTHQTNLPLELNLQRYGGGGGGGGGVGYVFPASVGGGSGGGGGGSSSNEASRSSVPLGPFTGYASILRGSRFLKPAQQLLEEFCDVGRGICAEKFAPDSSLMEPPLMESLSGGDDGCESRRKKSRLISMLDEVYRRYKQYYQQIQAVLASFEYVAGLGNAAPYANLALKTMSKHFKCLKNAITDQLQFTNKAHGQISHGKDEAARFGNTDRGFYGQRPVNNSAYPESNQPVWRPQRGLPERAVTVLRGWLFEHFLHPYPTDTDKIMLAKQTGLSRSQVSNWFINARVRLWKPMVEEIHMLETRQAHKGNLQREDQRNGNKSSNHLGSTNSITSENPSSSQRIQDAPSKCSRNQLPDISPRNEEPMNMSYNNLSSNPQVGIGTGMASGSGSVSLTLGLHQNNVIGMSEPFQINAAQRFGLEGSNEGYVMSGFEAQHRHFGRDVVGGQLLHDFVG